jgi:hypothetical protein
MNWLIKAFGVNWKSNLISVVALLGTIPAIITATTQFINHQPVDWRAAAGGTLLALLAYVVKDASTHSIPAQSEAALAKAEGQPNADILVKQADQQAAGK